jgi:tetratricopeptide (TPR) repeat protein
LGTLRPTIRWAPIAGAKPKTLYTVTLYGEGMQVIWTREVVADTRFAYPDNEPPLAHGRVYKVAVAAEGQSSQQDHSPGLGFQTLTADQAQKLAAEAARRKQLGLPDGPTRYLLANLYAANELYSEAIEQLEDLSTTITAPPVIETLGDLYAVIGLNREAEKKYLEALALTPANDLEGRGATENSLAQVYENLGIFDRAVAHLAEARKVYQRLRNWALVKALSQRERRLKRLRL